MATEFRLGYTGVEINQKLAKVDEIEIALENEYYTSTDIDTKIDEVNTSIEEVNASINEVNTSIEEVNTSIETGLQGKADLIDGKVPLEQLPDDIGSGGGLTEVFWKDIKDAPFGATVGSVALADNLSFTSFDVSDGEGLLYAAQLELNSYEIGEKASVLFDGVSYELTRKYSEELESHYFGNGSVVNVMGLNLENTNEPFMFVCDEEDGGICMIYLADTQETTHTISISVVAEIIKTLDSKYIADMYYDTRKIYHFDSNETPNPPSYPIPGFGVNGYKIFDLTPTLEEFSNYKIIKDGTTELTFANQQIILSWDGAWMIQSDTSYYFGLCLRSGTFEAEFQGMSVVCEVPEPGIYFMYDELPLNITFELNLGGELKQIDPKFIPADLDFNLDDYYTKSETYNKSEVDNAISNVDLSRYYTKDEVDNIIGDIDSVINEINGLIGE